MMGTSQAADGDRYEIVIGRRLGSRSTRAFERFELIEIPGDGMLLRGRVPDQAALHGVLAQIRDMGIPLVAVRLAADAGRSPETDASNEAE
jgi:hypothetical protein